MNERVIKRRPFKGSVLFTVLVVMIVMLILMIATIGLASNASRRAYYEYNEHQTTSTARSVVESTIEHLRTNTDLGEAIVNNVKSVGNRVDVTVNGGNDLGEGFGHVDHLFFENVGTDSASSFNITGSGKPIIKVTAVVTQGGVTSTYAQYCIGDVESDDDASSGGGLVALGGFNGTAEPGVDAYSPAYFGVSDSFSYKELVNLSNANKGQLNSIVINSSATTKTQMRVALGKKEGLSIMGNFSNNVGALHVYNDNYSDTDYKNDLSGSTKITDNAYVYIGGCFDLGQKFYIGKGESDGWDEAQKDQAPINLYCGRINMGGSGSSAKLCGNIDIYCYNEGTDAPLWDNGSPSWSDDEAKKYAENPWSRIGAADASHLISWAEKLSDTSNRKSTYDSGSFYTMGNLEFRQKFEVAGDLFVKGNLNLEDVVTGDSKIKGNVYVAGTIGGTDAAKLTDICEGVIYNGAADVDDKHKAYSTSVLPAKVNAFLSGDLTLANLKSNTILTADKVYNEFYENKKDEHGVEIPGEKTVKGSVNKSKLVVDGTTKVYTESGGNIVGQDLDYMKDPSIDPAGHVVTAPAGTYGAEISGNCILKGSFNKDIYVNPTGTVWIDCFNLELNNGASIVVNDSNGSVNFFFPTDKTGLTDSNVTAGYEAIYKTFFEDLSETETKNIDVYWPVEYHQTITNTYNYNNRLITRGSGNYIRTVNYAEKFTSGTELVRYPTADTDTNNDWMLPKVGLYAREGGKVLVRFENPIFVSGDIFMPGANFYAKSQCKIQNLDFTYNGKPVESRKVAFVGSIIVDNINEFNNDMSMIYVDDPPGGGEHESGDTIYVWNPLNGYADY